MKQIAETTLRRMTKNAMYHLIRDYEREIYKLEIDNQILKANNESMQEEMCRTWEKLNRIERGKHENIN